MLLNGLKKTRKITSDKKKETEKKKKHPLLLKRAMRKKIYRD